MYWSVCLFIASGLLATTTLASTPLRNIVCKEDEQCDNSICCYFEDLFAVPDTAYNFQSTLHPAHIRKIRFVKSNFPEIPPGMFAYFTSVVDVDFSHSGISKTNDYSFNGARRLITLNLSNNQIAKLVNMMFYGAFRLGYLDLSHNRISVIEEGAFYGIKGLTTLDLSHNLLTTLPEKVFFSLESLYMLNLSHNLLNSLHTELFIDNLYLTKIDLSHNDLVELDNKVFRYNKNIRQLNLSQNALDNVDFIGEMDFLHIEDIDLSRNPLGYLNYSVVGAMKNLRRLNVAETDQNYVDFTELGRLKNLYALNISHNHLGKIAFNETAAVENLVRLYMDGTGVQYLNSRVVKRALPNLKHVSLSGNKWNCNYLKSVTDELRQLGVEEVDYGTDCGRRPANYVAYTSQRSCADEVALARIKIKEIIAGRLVDTETKLRDEIKRIVNKKVQEIIDEVNASVHNYLDMVIE